MTPIKNCIVNKDTTKNPIWLMRQAGRYLPEFREIRKNNQDFIKLCLNENLSSEITLQPIKRFGFDAAIIFSDILMLPYAINQEVNFEKGFGPKLGNLNIDKIKEISEVDFTNKLNPVYKAISITSKNDLLLNRDLIGFVGAPWTILVYMLNKMSPKKGLPEKFFSDSILINNLLDIIEKFINFIEPNDFVIISDYHKGTLDYNDIACIIKKCRNTDGVKVLVDTNYVYPEHEGIDWLKINLKTAKECIKKFSKDTAEKIAEMNNSNVIVTQGEEGFTAYLKNTKTTIVFTKDKNENCVDAIGAGDTFLAGFVSYLVKHNDADLPALVYADIVAHLSTQKLGTIDVVDVDEADAEYKNAKTSIEECKDTLYVHRTIVND